MMQYFRENIVSWSHKHEYDGKTLARLKPTWAQETCMEKRVNQNRPSCVLRDVNVVAQLSLVRQIKSLF